MGLLCTNCLIIHEKVLERYYHKVCKCSNQNIIEIDDLFILPIQVLNQKGYITQYCCSGHCSTIARKLCNSYIKFSNDVKLPSLPSGYDYDYNDQEAIEAYARKKMLNQLLNEVLIRKHFISSGEELYHELIENAKNVLNWAKSLPERE